MFFIAFLVAVLIGYVLVILGNGGANKLVRLISKIPKMIYKIFVWLGIEEQNALA